jgi:hypothetical protein
VNPLLIAKLLGWVARVPWWAWALAALLGWGLMQGHRVKAAKAEYAAAQVKAEKERAEAAARDRLETDRRTRAIMEASDAATIQARTNADAAARARAALDRVLLALPARPANAGAAGASAPGSSAPATNAGLVPADVLRRCGERVLGLAQYADAARTAGSACERAYDSLTTPKEPPK